MARVYCRDDPGSPVYGFGESGSIGWHAFKEILKACLINGYGSRVAAGWSLINEGDRFIVLRNGSGSGYVGFTHNQISDQFCTVWLAQTYIGMSGNFMNGDGLRSGLAAGNLVPHKFHMFFLAQHTDRSSWYVVADERTFVMAAGGFFDSSQIANADYDFRSFYVGETSDGYFVAVGGENVAGTSSARAHFNQLGATLLINPVTGLLVGSGAITVSIPSLYTTSPSSRSESLALGDIDVGRARIYGAGVSAGKMRGVVIVPDVALDHTYQAGLNLGLPIAVNARTFATALPMGDASTWFLGLKSPANTPGFLVSDKAEFW